MQVRERFRDRREAGRRLAERLQNYAGRNDTIVLGLPRGGVPVAYEVAGALHLPLDVFVVRKLGTPWHPELAMGALASGGVRVINQDLVRELNVPASEVERITQREQRELERRERLFRGNRPFPDVSGKTVLLIDDGLATGATMQVAVAALRQKGAQRVVVGVPVASPDTCDAFRDITDDIVCVFTPEPFYAVGFWYDDFGQMSDDEVHDLLDRGQAA
jgi:predicted phosphoribosyltransferase